MAFCRFSSMSESCLKVGMDLLNHSLSFLLTQVHGQMIVYEAHTLSDWGKKTVAGFPPGQCVPGNDLPYLLLTSEILEGSIGVTDFHTVLGVTQWCLTSFSTKGVTYSFARLVLKDGWTWNQGFTEVMVVIWTFKGISDWRPSGSLWSDQGRYLVPHLCTRDKTQTNESLRRIHPRGKKHEDRQYKCI